METNTTRSDTLRIKIRMIELQLNIKEVSQSFAGVCGYQRVARILRGDTVATKKERACFAKALRCSQKELFGEEVTA